MKANELMVGNYIIDDSGDVVTFQMTPIQIDYIDYFKPIPLTEEWLFKFGFTVNSISKGIFDKGIWFISDKGFWIDDEGGIRIANCEYVHQLQNIYFTLTGKELCAD